MRHNLTRLVPAVPAGCITRRSQAGVRQTFSRGMQGSPLPGQRPRRPRLQDCLAGGTRHDSGLRNTHIVLAAVRRPHGTQGWPAAQTPENKGRPRIPGILDRETQACCVTAHVAVYFFFLSAASAPGNPAQHHVGLFRGNGACADRIDSVGRIPDRGIRVVYPDSAAGLAGRCPQRAGGSLDALPAQ